ncbi:hypothetical protein FPV67DRAFT_210985 [Lyophyllum atratum]|nr:hypothetical protein FPV67DRAFT_210985 [Lyophyllum atratum]
MNAGLVIWSLVQRVRSTYALPLPSRDQAEGISPCTDLGHCRSVSDIVWSCLGTIFACTWVAVHPDVPTASESFITHRAKIFLTALIAPEFIVLWAFRQWLMSRKLTRKCKDEVSGWTKTHSFFLLMGGFTIHDNIHPERLLPALNHHAFQRFLRNRKIEFTEKEIQDKSKGDILAKSLVLLQVTWFILQFLARAIQHLPITELEIVTLAFALLNFLVYFCWWNKPLDVQCPLKVIVGSAEHADPNNATVLSKIVLVSSTVESFSRTTEDTTTERDVVDSSDTREGDNPINTFTSTETVSSRRTESMDSGIEHGPTSVVPTLSLPIPLPYPNETDVADHTELVGCIGSQVRHTPPGPTTRDGSDDADDGALRCTSRPPHLSPNKPKDRVSAAPISARCVQRQSCLTLRRLGQTLAQIAVHIWMFLPSLGVLCVETNGKLVRSFIRREGHKGVPSDTYHPGYLDRQERLMAYMLTCGTAALFGAIHCVAWSFQFPSDTEKLLWRASSITVTVLPVYGFLYTRYVTGALRAYMRNRHRRRILRFQFLYHHAHLFAAIFYCPAVLIYVAARLILLIQMFTLLRTRNPDIYQTAEWTTFIPHF